MKTIGQLLESKGKDIWSIAPGESVYEALRIMSRKDVGAVLVIDKEKLVGIFSERDYARKVILMGRASDTTKVADIMTSEVLTTTPAATSDQCMQIMTNRRCRHLPVVDDDRVIGVVSIGDLVQAIIADQKAEIEQLEHYISG